ncbi:hypothetical protein BC937DRAFT_94847 [Endogone sp. FLAS-F59071]|nr:hypothetical protein BC937DRAFT_94847 [Endogone sp. FLAS-F59071]|eukprot:RUS20595.1 hypothetical protein BC937DRAFT_94847 [Endogone sp. FLAS-F59071]
MSTALDATAPALVSSPMLSARPARTYPTTTLLPPTRSRFQGVELEYAVCAPTPRFQRELAHVFPERGMKSLRVVPVIQRCENDLVGVGAGVDKEKDEMLERFVTWGNTIIARLRLLGYWADLTDPASGYPLHSSPGASPYPDVQGTQTLLRYDVQSTGCCHILLHPTWGSRIYPATMFTDVDPETFRGVVAEVESEEEQGGKVA